MIKTAVIMSGGRGERMSPLTNHIPKPLIKLIDNKSLILHVMDELSRVGIENFYVTYGWLGNKVLEELSNDSRIKGFINTDGKSNAWWVTDSILSNLNEDILICPADLIFNVNKEKFQEIGSYDGLWLLSTESKSLTGDIIWNSDDVNDFDHPIVHCIFKDGEPTPHFEKIEKASGLQITNPMWLNYMLGEESYGSWYDIWSKLIKTGEMYNLQGCVENITSFDTLTDIQRYLDRNTLSK